MKCCDLKRIILISMGRVDIRNYRHDETWTINTAWNIEIWTLFSSARHFAEKRLIRLRYIAPYWCPQNDARVYFRNVRKNVVCTYGEINDDLIRGANLNGELTSAFRRFKGYAACFKDYENGHNKTGNTARSKTAVSSFRELKGCCGHP